MARTGVVIDRRYLEHDTGRGHPERPQRIATLLDWMDGAPGAWMRLEPRAATGDEIALAHDAAYVAEVERTREREWFAFDADTPTSPLSYDTALLAAGGFLNLLDAIVAGEIDNGFACVRPPGHHAERAQAMGFCLFNNVAVGAAYLRQRHGLRRILVVDWDVHHGNGTQHIFERDPQVLFVSTHQYPFYPGTGAMAENGRGDGEGFTVNLPFPAGGGDELYLDAFRRVIEPIANLYAPEFVLISAGFDAHAADPLGSMRVTEDGFRAMTDSLLGIAAEHCGGRCAAILEGGYDLHAIRASVAAVLEQLSGTGSSTATDRLRASASAPVVDEILRRQQHFWRV